MIKIWDKIKLFPGIEKIVVTGAITSIVFGSIIILQEIDKATLEVENAQIIVAHNKLAAKLSLVEENRLNLYKQNRDFAFAVVEQSEQLKRAKELIIRQNNLIADLMQQIEELKILNSVSSNSDSQL